MSGKLCSHQSVLDYFMLFLDIGLFFFFLFFPTNHREVQAAMQMSLSWEESLSLVMNPHPAPLSVPPSP